ncbi:MAG: tRNA pseudouridine(55) synthase TruB [Vicinamibacterales bacterium]
MDGLLVIDKPAGPTSHDVVARVRRTLGEKRVGHTGTLDPAASGVLPLVVGRATRLAQFLSGSEKEYRAVIRLGVSTDTYDGAGAVTMRHRGALPPREAVEQALDSFQGPIVQIPPAFSAKKIDGKRSHRLARRATAANAIVERPAAVEVTAHRLTLVAFEADRLEIDIECSAGFYVRSLAHDLGERLGTGAHLESLRRTRSGDLTIETAVPLAHVDGDAAAARAALIPLRRMLVSLPAVRLTAEGADAARHGRMLGRKATQSDWPALTPAGSAAPPIRLLDPDDELLGLARWTGETGAELHPFVVLAIAPDVTC